MGSVTIDGAVPNLGDDTSSASRPRTTSAVVTRSGGRSDVPEGLAHEGGLATTAPWSGHGANPVRAIPPGRTHDLTDVDEPYDIDVPGGALGDLVRRWGGPIGRSDSDTDEAGEPVVVRQVAPGVERRRPTDATIATARRTGRPNQPTADAPAGDEHLLDVLDVALTELLRRDAERHGLGGLLS